MQDQFDSQYVLCKPEVHFSDLCCFRGQHHGSPYLHYCSDTQVIYLINSWSNDFGVYKHKSHHIFYKKSWLLMQVWGSWSAKSSWNSKSPWDLDFLSWGNDHDTIQGTHCEKFVASSNPCPTRKCCYQWELVKGFTSYSFMLCYVVYMVHYAGFHLN